MVGIRTRLNCKKPYLDRFHTRPLSPRSRSNRQILLPQRLRKATSRFVEEDSRAFLVLHAPSPSRSQPSQSATEANVAHGTTRQQDERRIEDESRRRSAFYITVRYVVAFFALAS